MYPRQYSSDLSMAFSGTDAELEANRRGMLTSWQLENLPFRASDARSSADFGSAVKTALTTIAGAVVAFAFFAFLLVNAERLGERVPPALRPLAFGIIIVAVISALVWLAYAAVTQNRAARTWETSRTATMHVEAMNARVQPIIDRVDGEEHIYLEANGRRLMTNKRTLKAFRAGRQYRLYYVNGPTGSWLVNAEDAPESG
jgi:hypothetical protein